MKMKALTSFKDDDKIPEMKWFVALGVGEGGDDQAYRCYVYVCVCMCVYMYALYGTMYVNALLIFYCLINTNFNLM